MQSSKTNHQDSKTEGGGLNLAAQFLVLGTLLGFFLSKFADNNHTMKRASNSDVFKLLDLWMVYHQTRKLDLIVRAGVELIMGSFDFEQT